MKPPLVFLVPAIVDPPTTGGERYNLELARRLGGTFEVETLTLADLGVRAVDGPEAFRRALVRWADRRGRPAPLFEDTWFYELAAGANRAIRRMGFGPIVGFAQAVYPERYRAPWARGPRFVRLRRYLATLDGQVGVSGYFATVNRRLGLPTTNVRSVYPGFELARLPVRTRAPGEGGLRVITAGSYMPAKGQHLVVDAARWLRFHAPAALARTTLRCVGPTGHAPGFLDGLRARVDAGRLPVALDGPLPQTDLWGAFAESDVFAFLAEGEGFGMVVLEAMLCGAVPIVVDSGPLREVVGDAGIVVERDGASLGRAIAELAGDRAKLARLAAAATARTREVALDWDGTTARVVSALRSLGV